MEQAASDLAFAHHPPMLAAMGARDFETAYRHATAMPAQCRAPHALDVVEAAMRTGHRAEAAACVADLLAGGAAARSPRMALVVAGARAIAGADLCLFAAAVATPGAERWQFDLARIRLVYGERLRRARATLAAREQLTAARDAFDRMGAQPWSAWAVAELRATGFEVRRGGIRKPVRLTPQEHEVAELAAAGLTHKEIGERLFLSHRTVGTHLYQVFPKLGIHSRAALRDALATSFGERLLHD